MNPRLRFLARIVQKECRHLETTDRRLFEQPFTVERADQLENAPDLAGRVGSVLLHAVAARGDGKLVTRTHAALDLTCAVRYARPATRARRRRSPVWGTGTPRREFLYSDDMVDARVFLMNLPDARFDTLLGSGSTPSSPPANAAKEDFLPPLVNIGSGKDLTIRNLAEAVRATVGYEGEIVFDATKPDGTPQKLLDVSRLEALGWRAPTGLGERLAAAYRDYTSRA